MRLCFLVKGILTNERTTKQGTSAKSPTTTKLLALYEREVVSCAAAASTPYYTYYTLPCQTNCSPAAYSEMRQTSEGQIWPCWLTGRRAGRHCGTLNASCCCGIGIPLTYLRHVKIIFTHFHGPLKVKLLFPAQIRKQLQFDRFLTGRYIVSKYKVQTPENMENIFCLGKTRRLVGGLV